MQNCSFQMRYPLSCLDLHWSKFIDLMHVARHSFATTVTLANNVSIESVSKMMGHKNIRMTQHYAKILEQTVVREMGELSGKLDYSY